MSVSYYKVIDGSGVPKYQQLIQSIERAIEDKRLNKGDRIASINELCLEFGISRDTVLTAYNKLKTKGLIESIPGKGYYISSLKTTIKHKVFVLFDEFNAFKQQLYSSFIKGMKKDAEIDLYFHNFNTKIFRNLILSNVGVYTSYIIMPANLVNLSPILAHLDSRSVYILDQTNNVLAKKYPGIVQNFSEDIYAAMDSGKDLLKKYKRLILVFPSYKEPLGLKEGFLKYCEDKEWKYEIIKSLEGRKISEGDVYITPNDNDLVHLIKLSKMESFKIGEEIGLISYNDTPLKEVLCDGITTISTDFTSMGVNMANMILKKQKVLKMNPSRLIRRKSL